MHLQDLTNLPSSVVERYENHQKIIFRYKSEGWENQLPPLPPAKSLFLAMTVGLKFCHGFPRFARDDVHS